MLLLILAGIFGLSAGLLVSFPYGWISAMIAAPLSGAAAIGLAATGLYIHNLSVTKRGDQVGPSRTDSADSTENFGRP